MISKTKFEILHAFRKRSSVNRKIFVYIEIETKGNSLLAKFDLFYKLYTTVTSCNYHCKTNKSQWKFIIEDIKVSMSEDEILNTFFLVCAVNQ